MKFTDLGLIDPILKAIEDQGYTSPTPIQEKSIPVLLKKNDLLGCAQTGTGKTAAFTIPILHIQEKQFFIGTSIKTVSWDKSKNGVQVDCLSLQDYLLTHEKQF